MGGGSSKSKKKKAQPGEHNIDEAYDYKQGPLSKTQIKSRIETDGPKVVSAGSALSIKYAALSQRGYYPESLTKANQDQFKVDTTSFGDGNIFFGVFDGHGPHGDKVSGYVRDNVVPNFKKALKKGKGTLDDQITAALDVTNKGLPSKVDDRHSGTTSVTAFFQGTSLQVANVGDSRAVVATLVDGKLIAHALSSDQTPYRKDERERVRAPPYNARVCTMDQLDGLMPMNDDYDVALGEEIDEGGDPPRVWHPTRRLPGCAFTRSLGDSVAESLGVYAVPECANRELTPNDKFVVIASDGVWEFITSQNVIEMVTHYDDILEACRHVAAEAYRQWLIYDDRTDDITIIVCELQFAEGTAVVQETPKQDDGHHISEMRPVRRGMSKDKRKRMKAVTKISDEVYEQVRNFDVEAHTSPKTPEQEQQILSTLKGNFLFDHLNPAQRKTLVGLFSHRTVAKDETIIKQGDAGDFFYVVDSGHYDVHVKLPPSEGEDQAEKDAKNQHDLGMKVFEYNAPSSFGELALMHGKPRAATVTATEPGSLWCLSFLGFQATCTRTSHKELLAALRSVKVLNTLSTSQLQRMADITSEVKFNEGKTILKEGAASDSFYIVKSGSVVCYKAFPDGKSSPRSLDTDNGKEMMKLGALEYLNEKALLERTTVEYSFVAEKATVLLEISRSRFEEVLGQLDTVIAENSHRRRAWNHIQRLRVDENVNGLDHFTKLGQLWSTDTGNVSLVRSTENADHLFMLRANSKFQVKSRNEEKDVMKEKELMLHLPNHSQFFPELLKCFSDDKAVYSLHFFSGGTDMASMLSQAQDGALVCGEKEAGFYGVCLALAIERLQSMLVLSRSIVPDKVVLDNRGYPRLFDFRNAKRVDTDAELTFTMCGSPDYMSPEQVGQQGHGIAADIWALGILLYEVMSGGNTPFRESDNSTETAIYSNITNHKFGELKCPAEFSKNAQDLLNNLLNPDAKARTEFSKSWKNHPWWNGFDFNATRRGVVTAPHVAFCQEKVDNVVNKGEKMAAASSFADDGDGDFGCFDGYTLMDRYFVTAANAPASFSGVVWRKSFVKKKK